MELEGDTGGDDVVGSELPSPRPGLRDDSRARRVRALLCTAPIHDLQAGRAMRGGIFPDLDCFDLALGAIDFVVDRMGFDTGAEPEDVVTHLFDEIADWVPNASTDDAEAAARVINEALIRPQRGLYSEPDDPTRRPFDFALLREEPSIDGIRVIATNEAINVLVGALDTEVASAVAAAEAKLESLLSRRRFGDAEQAARDARIRSIQWMTEIRRLIADTRLDVRRAGWDEAAPAKLAEIVEDLAKQMTVERRMLEAMRDSRDIAERDDLARTTQHVIAVVEDCLNRHRELHARVMDATETFFVEHKRQAFLPTSSLVAIDIYDRLFRPALRGSVHDVGDAIDVFAQASWGVADIRVANIERLIDILLADPRQWDHLGEELPDDELEDEHDVRRFSKTAWDAVEAALNAFKRPERLSSLLSVLEESGQRDAAELVGLLSLRAADPALADLRRTLSRVLAAADDGELLDSETFVGADLIVGWLEPDREALAEMTS